MKLAFDEIKATQTAAFFLKLADGELNYMALIKLLYRADREAIRRWGLPITTDHYVSMKYGPVTSTIYDLIKKSAIKAARPTTWSTHIQKANDPNSVRLEGDPGESELSRAEKRLIDEVFSVYGKKDRFDLADECHADFPEWQDPGNSSIPIQMDEIIEALEMSEDDATHVKTSIAEQQAAYKLAI